MSDVQPPVPGNRQYRPEGGSVDETIAEPAVVAEPVAEPVIGDTLVVDEVTVVDETGAVRTESVTPTPVAIESVHATPTEPVVATADPAAVAIPEPVAAPVPEPAPVAPGPQYVYVHAPAEPKKHGNRGIGSLIAIGSAIIYAAVFAIVVFVIRLLLANEATFTFVLQPSFYVPVLFYVIGLVLLVLILNRAGWAAYVVGSILVGVLVYFGTIGVLALGQNVVAMTPQAAGLVFGALVFDPFVIAAALVAREVSLWMGHLISRRGRRVKARNAEARDAWQRELADTRAERDRASSAAPAAG